MSEEPANQPPGTVVPAIIIEGTTHGIHPFHCVPVLLMLPAEIPLQKLASWWVEQPFHTRGRKVIILLQQDCPDLVQWDLVVKQAARSIEIGEDGAFTAHELLHPDEEKGVGGGEI